jgi:hypothetical protein
LISSIGKGLIENNQVALIFEGFQLLINDAITQELLDECRNLALDKTGYDIELKIKPFDNALSLPDDFADSEDDLPSLINKYNENLNEFVSSKSKLIDYAISDPLPSSLLHQTLYPLHRLDGTHCT